MPIISIIVPVYKVEDYIDRCVESILAQTFVDFELILVDDGSPDNCPAMCDSWAEKDSRIKVIHKENGGLSDARNVGFAASCGEWITFIDSDDYMHPQMLQALYDAVRKYGTKLSACAFTRTDGEPLEQDQDLTANRWSAEDYYMQRHVNATIACGKLYHRSVILPYPIGKLHEDEFVTYRILFACEQIAVLDAALYGYYQNAQGIMKSGWSTKRMLDKQEALAGRLEYLSSKLPGLEAGCAQMFFRFSVNILCPMYRQGDRISVQQGVDLLLKHHDVVKKYANKYERLYLPLLKTKYGRHWVLRNDFEPIQKIIRKVKMLK